MQVVLIILGIGLLGFIVWQSIELVKDIKYKRYKKKKKNDSEVKK